MMATDAVEIVLEISGLGIIFYSPQNAKHIAQGTDYLSSHFTSESQVQSHIQQGTIVGFGTGTPGTFVLRIHSGYPAEDDLRLCEFKLRLGLHCVGGSVCFRDLSDLLPWDDECAQDRVLNLEDGYYHVTLCSDVPESGILGDDQVVRVYLQKLEKFPNLAVRGIPTLCW